MPKQNFNDRMLKALKPAAAGKRYEKRDALVPGLLVRVTETGKRTFMLQTRFPGSTQPTRRAIGEYDAVSLDRARKKAREWHELIGKGIDPAIAEEEERRGALRKQANTFASVVEKYLETKVIGPDPEKPRQRKGREVAREFRGVFVALWGERPITSIAKGDVLALIEGVRDHGTPATLAAFGKGAKAPRKPAPAHARNLLGYLKTFFRWAAARDVYGLNSSPCEFLSAADLIGKKQSDDRTLTDAELLALTIAADQLGYPYGPVYRLLLLTGLRLNEVADATWSEFEEAKGIWIIPAARMKNGRPHSVPLTADIVAILESLPRFHRGEYLFSMTAGESPVWITDKVKKRLDKAMLAELKTGNTKVKLEPWKNHHLRHTLKTRLHELRIDGDVAEAILSHKEPGIRGVYNHYEYFDEKRDALELWASHLAAITSQRPTSVAARAVPVEGPRAEIPRANFAARLSKARA